ncbi:ZZ-type zinc finger-containing protein [Pelomyxa schiedti]|nr:ZZ-type zinc finger-containing protein [Pelomyxa schiedti]
MASRPSLEQLRGLVDQLLLQSVPRESVALMWLDEEGDLVTMSTQSELDHALDLIWEEGILRLFVKRASPAASCFRAKQRSSLGQPNLPCPPPPWLVGNLRQPPQIACMQDFFHRIMMTIHNSAHMAHLHCKMRNLFFNEDLMHCDPCLSPTMCRDTREEKSLFCNLDLPSPPPTPPHSPIMQSTKPPDSSPLPDYNTPPTSLPPSPNYPCPPPPLCQQSTPIPMQQPNQPEENNNICQQTEYHQPEQQQKNPPPVDININANPIPPTPQPNSPQAALTGTASPQATPSGAVTPTSHPCCPENAIPEFSNFVEQLVALPVVKNTLTELVPQLVPDFVDKIDLWYEWLASPDSAQEVEPRIICDGCSQAITGSRFKCAACVDYDLCSDCVNKRDIHNPEHSFHKIPAASSMRWCPYSRKFWPKKCCKPLPSCDLATNAAASAVQAACCPTTATVACCASAIPLCMCPESMMLAKCVADGTLEDGMLIETGVTYVKIWTVENEGKRPWPQGSRLVFVQGDRMSAPESMEVRPIMPGSRTELAVEVTASEPRRHLGFWQLVGPDNKPFGQRLWVDVIAVPKEQTPATPPQASPSSSDPDSPPQSPAHAPLDDADIPTELDLPTKEEQTNLETLASMGFCDTGLNLWLLRTHKNNLCETLRELLSHQD